MFSTRWESTPQGRAVVFSGCRLWKAKCLAGTYPKQDAASALKGMQAETRVPRASGMAD